MLRHHLGDDRPQHVPVLRLMAWLPRRLKAITADTPLDEVEDLDRSRGTLLGVKWPQVTSSIDRALRIMDARREAGWATAELQVVLQVSGPGPEYAKWKKDRDRLLRRSASRYGAGSWPPALPEGSIGVLLLPYPAGRVGPALVAAKLARPPVFRDVRLHREGEADLGVAQLLRDWLHHTPDDVALLLAPPVLERFRGPRLDAQEPFDLGLAWPLPAPAAG